MLLFACADPALHAQTPETAASGDGKTIFVRSLATAKAGGLQRALARQDLIYVADTLRTSPTANARFVMRDQTLLSMQPDTEIVLAEYQFKPAASGQDKMVTRVVSGSLRALTGLVDKRDPDRVTLQTPLSTAGVRGTALRVDLYPGGVEEIAFDFGQGWVENGAGRVEVATGWGARVSSATAPPRLFKLKRDPRDPAELALAFLGRSAADPGNPPAPPPDKQAEESALSEVSAKAADAAQDMAAADQVLLIGMLEQVPAPDTGRALAVLEGLLRTSTDLDAELIMSAVGVAPTRSADVLRAAARSGVDVATALADVLSALLPWWPEQVRAVIDAAVALGLDPQEAQRILDAAEQPVPCEPGEAGQTEEAVDQPEAPSEP